MGKTSLGGGALSVTAVQMGGVAPKESRMAMAASCTVEHHFPILAEAMPHTTMLWQSGTDTTEHRQALILPGCRPGGLIQQHRKRLTQPIHGRSI